MDPTPGYDRPSGPQIEVIQTMLQTINKPEIIKRLLASRIYFAHQEAEHVWDDADTDASFASRPDVFGPFRLYKALTGDEVALLAPLQGISLLTIAQWIDNIGDYAKEMDTPSNNANPRPNIAACQPSTAERVHSAISNTTLLPHQMSTEPRPRPRIKVKEEYFPSNCELCMEKGYNTQSQKKLNTHLKRFHAAAYRTESGTYFCPCIMCYGAMFNNDDLWAKHVIDDHCHLPGMVVSALPSLLRSQSSRYDPSTTETNPSHRSTYQSTPGPGTATDISSLSSRPQHSSDYSSHYGGFPGSFSKPETFVDFATRAQQPHVPFAPQPLAQMVSQNTTAASVNNTQSLYAYDQFGHRLYTLDGNPVFRTCDGQQAFAVNTTGSLFYTVYGSPVLVTHGQLLNIFPPLGSPGTYQYGINLF